MARHRSGVVVLTGTGPTGQAIARRISAGRILILADSDLDNAELAARSLLQTGFTAVPTTVDVTSRESVQTLCDFAVSQGHLTHLIHTASAAPTHTTATEILTAELYGTALILEKFGDVITNRGAGIIISSHAGHRLPALYAAEDRQLAITPTEKLLNLPMLRYITDPVHAMQIAKRGNTLRVQAAAMTWGARGARINVISPGIIMTPMAPAPTTSRTNAKMSTRLDADTTTPFRGREQGMCSIRSITRVDENLNPGFTNHRRIYPLSIR